MDYDRRPLFLDPVFWLAISAAGFIIILTLWYGIGVDAAVYSYCAYVWKHFDLPPYIGCKEGDYPGIFIIHRIALLFGENALGFRIFDCLVQLSSLGMIYYLARRLSRLSLAGLFACMFYATFYYSLFFPFVGEREAFIFWFMLAALVSGLSLSSRVYWRAAITGLLVGFAFLVKPTFGLLWPAFGIWFLLEGIKQPARKIGKELAIFAFCCLAPSLIVLLLYWRWGYLRELYEMTIYFVFKVYAKMPVYIRLEGTGEYIKINPRSMILNLFKEIVRDNVPALAGVILVLPQLWLARAEKEWKLFWIILGLILVSFISADLQRGVWLYHRIPFWGFTFILAGWGWAWLFRFFKGKEPIAWRKVIYACISLGLIGLMIIRVPSSMRSFAFHFAFRSMDQAYMEQYPLPLEVAKYIKQIKIPDDQIYYFGNISMLPFLLQTKLGAPFPFTVHLYQRFEDGSLSPLQEKWRRDYTNTFLQMRPRLFIFDTICWFCKDQTLKPLFKSEFPEIQKALDANYHLIKSADPIEIYELN